MKGVVYKSRDLDVNIIGKVRVWDSPRNFTSSPTLPKQHQSLTPTCVPISVLQSLRALSNIPAPPPRSSPVILPSLSPGPTLPQDDHPPARVEAASSGIRTSRCSLTRLSTCPHAKQISRPSDLKNLCLVCKELQDIAAPRLYAHVTVNLLDLSKAHSLLKGKEFQPSEYLKATKALTLFAETRPFPEESWGVRQVLYPERNYDYWVMRRRYAILESLTEMYGCELEAFRYVLMAPRSWSPVN